MPACSGTFPRSRGRERFPCGRHARVGPTPFSSSTEALRASRRAAPLSSRALEQADAADVAAVGGIDPPASQHDPIANGRWVTYNGVSFILPDYDFTDPSWMTRVEEDMGWDAFWEFFEDVTQGDKEVEDEPEVLQDKKKWAASADRAEKAIAARRADPDARVYRDSGRLALTAAEKREAALAAQDIMGGTPNFVNHMFDLEEGGLVPEPNRAEDRPINEDLTPIDLRARREKQLYNSTMDLFWRMISDWENSNVEGTAPHDTRDIRIKPLLRGYERFDWTEDDVWNLITNDGESVDPYRVAFSDTFLVQNPHRVWDWASQGIEYVEEMEDWYVKEGMWGPEDHILVFGDDGDDGYEGLDEMEQDEDWDGEDEDEIDEDDDDRAFIAAAQTIEAEYGSGADDGGRGVTAEPVEEGPKKTEKRGRPRKKRTSEDAGSKAKPSDDNVLDTTIADPEDDQNDLV